MNRCTTTILALALSRLLGPAAAGGVEGREPVVGGPCEGCEAVFEGLPAELTSASRIAPNDEPGEPMRIEGRVTLEDGTPAGGNIVYAYHTDARGIYPKDEKLRGQACYRHGTLRGWAMTDSLGHYRFDTIRPAGYPDSDMPQHVHMHVIEPGRCTYYIDSIVFRDDPRMTREKLEQYTHKRGGSGVVTPRRDDDGTWVVERDIVLGQGVPGYPERTKPKEKRGTP
jgi:protocatechuate 3,4-dioxygenase beta subunit